MRDEYIWQSLLRDAFVDKTYDMTSKMFAISMYKNDMKYIKTNYKSIKKNKNDIFLITVAYANNVDIVKFIIDKFIIDVNYTNKFGNNCLIISCWKNSNLEIITYLTMVLKINTYHVNNDDDDCLSYACRGNKNIEIIKYLINNVKMDPLKLNKNGTNNLIHACFTNDNLGIVIYLHKMYKIDIKYKDKLNNCCLSVACYKNSNVEIVEYLIKECNIENLDEKEKYLTLSLGNSNNDVCAYVIKQYLTKRCDNNINININISQKRFKEIIPNLIDNYQIFNMWLTIGLKKEYINDDIRSLILLLNPIILTEKNQEIFSTKKTKTETFQKFKMLADEYNHEIEISEYYNDQIIYDDMNDIDFSKNTKLFIYDDIQYYGNREIYELIETMDKFDHKDDQYDVILDSSIKLPKYAVNLYILSCYTKQINLDKINKDDFIFFLKFIEQYPTTFMTINSLEKQMLEYIKKHEIKCDNYFMILSLKYQLKAMYIYIHNAEIYEYAFECSI